MGSGRKRKSLGFSDAETTMSRRSQLASDVWFHGKQDVPRTSSLESDRESEAIVVMGLEIPSTSLI
jgi:hypothetical protein